MASVPDVIRPELTALFVGINPDPISTRTRHHFANPVNPFWKLLHQSGFTPRQLAPEEEALLLEWDLGITNLASRTTREVGELTRSDVERGRDELHRKIERYRPRAIVFIGITGYRMFSSAKGHISCGEQTERVAGARVFVLPHPSGRNAHFRRHEMLDLWRSVREAIRS